MLVSKLSAALSQLKNNHKSKHVSNIN